LARKVVHYAQSDPVFGVAAHGVRERQGLVGVELVRVKLFGGFQDALDAPDGVSQPVVQLQAAGFRPQHFQSLRVVQRAQPAELKPPFEGGIAFQRPHVVRGGRSNAGDFAAAERGLEHVGSVQIASARAAGAHNGVNLIDEENDVLGFPQVTDEVVHPLFKLSAQLGSSHHAAHIQ
jgi:hypothetical protein